MENLPKVSLPKVNVNVGVFTISLIAIGVGEYYKLCSLWIFGIIAGLFSLISLGFCLFAYTRRYIKNKGT